MLVRAILFVYVALVVVSLFIEKSPALMLQPQ
jgi:hypothetical protein